MEPGRDPHQLLGLPRDATPGEIRAAYRRLAKRFHPDVNPEDPEAEEKFKELQRAYEEITNGDRREPLRKDAAHPHAQDGSPGPEDHPFFSFFAAVRAYYARRR